MKFFEKFTCGNNEKLNTIEKHLKITTINTNCSLRGAVELKHIRLKPDDYSRINNKKENQYFLDIISDEEKSILEGDVINLIRSILERDTADIRTHPSFNQRLLIYKIPTIVTVDNRKEITYMSLAQLAWIISTEQNIPPRSNELNKLNLSIDDPIKFEIQKQLAEINPGLKGGVDPLGPILLALGIVLIICQECCGHTP